MKFYRAHVLVAKDSRSIVSGAENIEKLLIAEIKKLRLDKEVAVVPTGDLGYAGEGVSIAVYPEGVVYAPVTAEDVPVIAREHLLKGKVLKNLAVGVRKAHSGIGATKSEKVIGIQKKILLKNVGGINPENIEEYIAADGYQALGKAVSRMKPQEVLAAVRASELRGRGGAGYPTGMKWESAAGEPAGEKYIICNADEGEPGTFKDREIMEGDPHLLVEGTAIAGYAVGASKGYIYIRGEYGISIRRLQKAIDDAAAYGLLGKNILGSGFDFDIEIKKGAGAYICGEESALIESIEGKRGEPRKKPPYPTKAGLWGKPTVINNVETLANVPAIIENGAEWYKSIGVPGSRGTKLFSLMGDINWKGVIEIPFGTRLADIITGIGGGVKGGKKLKGVILGGVSGFLIRPEETDVKVDFDSLARIEAGPGSGSIIVLDETRSIVDIMRNIMYFFRHESCGKCTPCRVGVEQIYSILDYIFSCEGIDSDMKTLEDIGRNMALTSFCPLGQTAPNIMMQSLKKYGAEWQEYIARKK